MPEGTSYVHEIPISYRAESAHVALEVSGRIDGVIRYPSGITIHEIKTTTLPIVCLERDHNPRHWARLKCYAFMYSSIHKLEHIGIRLTYFNMTKCRNILYG